MIGFLEFVRFVMRLVNAARESKHREHRQTERDQQHGISIEGKKFESRKSNE